MNRIVFKSALLIAVFFIFLCPLSSKAFSVFAHMAIIDASWKKSIVPLLKEKYPNATDEELRVAHSYAYGGSLMPDMGYFPFGSEYFTNLVHYVRSGDFMENLVSQAQNINEYAFALGAVSHYLTDEYGHSLATNVAEPIVYPKVAKKFGKLVTYEEYPIYHSRMEFGFDVLQMARGNYASQAYHDFIGFNVAKPVLERAFMLTYGQDMNDVFNGKLDLAISTFRWSVRSLLPSLTRTAWALKKSDIQKLNQGMTSRKFHYHIKRREYFKDYGRERDKPKLGNRIMAFIISILPKVGPLKALKFSPPGPVAEKLFIKSFDTTLVCYNQLLTDMRSGRQLQLVDMDFDTGKPTQQGEYGLADLTYSQLLLYLQDKKFNDVTPPLQNNILSFYSKGDTTSKVTEYKKYKVDWKKTYLALQQLRTVRPTPIDSLKLPVDTTAKATAPKTK
ncbi:MAG TPA: zinc dependent phospholipase C family protein [Mucilaginibacter sp.]|nr:zinc dependent phospholipase C family protein [Mucilaginibacter sp.]